MKSMLCTFVGVALLSWGTAAFADGTVVAQAMQSSTMATLVCRPARSEETATATTADKVALVCKPLDMKPIMAMKPHIETMPNGAKMWESLVNDFDLKGGH
jgi:hypothetical protein